MKVFKFGGASVKDAQGVRNVLRVLEATNERELVVVVSAMDKMTNHLEAVVDAYLAKDPVLESLLSGIRSYHFEIMEKLFDAPGREVFAEVDGFIHKLRNFLKNNRSQKHSYVYDQVVGFGELIATSIVSAYLAQEGVANNWLDVRHCVLTDDNFRDARVDWAQTKKAIKREVAPQAITVTQGFLGAEIENGFTTTLGREGSDYTAAIFAYCLDAESVTIWKDVPGLLNADPRHFKDSALIDHISYEEAIELAFYGASVIHPKTLQPLQRKEIPLFVKPFTDPTANGTCVGKGVQLSPALSCFILKPDLVLLSLSSLDFSIMMEDNISEVFGWLHQFKMKVELIQNSAISFSVCVDNKYNRLEELLSRLREHFKVVHYPGVTLFTARHATADEIRALIDGQHVLLKQEIGDTVQVITKQ